MKRYWLSFLTCVDLQTFGTLLKLRPRESILCVSAADDEHGVFIRDVCKELGIGFGFVDISLASLSCADLIVDGNKGWIQGCAVDASVAVWWRRPAAPRADDRITDRRLREYAVRQWDLACRALPSICAGFVVNDPSSERSAENKIMQLRAAARCGFTVPRTMVTNKPLAAERFIKELASQGKRCIFKSLYPGRFHFGETRLIASVESLAVELSLAPVIFQEYVERASDLRVTIFGGHVYSAEVISRSEIDWRLDPCHYYEPRPFSQEACDKAFALLEDLGLGTGSFDFRISKNGAMYFLEVNPSGQFLYLHRFGYPDIGSMFARFLIGEEA